MLLKKSFGLGFACLVFALGSVCVTAQDAPSSTENTKLTAQDCWNTGKKTHKEAENFEMNLQYKEALDAYNDAISCFRAAENADPTFYPDIIASRIESCKKAIASLERNMATMAAAKKTPTLPGIAQPVRPEDIVPRAVTNKQPGVTVSFPPAPVTEPVKTVETVQPLPASAGIAAQVGQMEQEIKTLRDANAKLVNDVNTLQASLRENSLSSEEKMKVEQLQKTVEDLNMKLMEERSRVKVLDEMVNRSTGRAAEGDIHLKNMTEKCQIAERELAQTKSSLDQTVKSLDSVNETLRGKSEQIAILEKNKTEITQKLDSAEKNGTQLSAELKTTREELKKEVDAVTEKLKITEHDASENLKKLQIASAENLKKIQDEYNAQIDALKKTVAETTAKNTEILKQKEDVTAQLTAKEKSILELTAQVKVLDSTVGSSAEKNRAELTRLEKEKSDLSAAAAEIQKKADQHAASLNVQINELKKLNAEKSSGAETQIAAAKERLQGEIEALKMQVEALQKTDESRADALKQTDNLLEKTRAEKQTAEIALKSTQERLAALEKGSDVNEEIVRLNQANKNLVGEIENLRTKLANPVIPAGNATENELNTLRRDMALNENNLESMKKQLSTATDEIERLTEALNKERSDKTAVVKTDDSASKTELEALRTRLKNAEEALTKAKSGDDESRQKEAELVQLRSEVQKLKSGNVNADYEAQIKRKNNAIDTLMKERTELSKKVMDLQVEVERLSGIRP